MTIPMPPDPEWHKQKTPEEWQAIQTQALQDHRANPQDQEAMNAIRDSNEALNMYEQPAIIAGEHTLASGWGNPLEAVKGEAEGGLDALLAPFHLANTVYRNGAAAGVDEVWNGLKSVPGEIMSGDPRRIGRVAGGVAGGIATGKGIGKLAGKVSRGFGQAAEMPRNINNLLEDISDNMKGDNPEAGGSMSPKPKGPKPPMPKTPDILGRTDPGAQAKAKFKNLDPYNLNDLSKAKPPSDLSGNIMDQIRTMDAAPWDILSGKSIIEGPRPLTPEQINQLLNSLRPPNPPGQ